VTGSKGKGRRGWWGGKGGTDEGLERGKEGGRKEGRGVREEERRVWVDVGEGFGWMWGMRPSDFLSSPTRCTTSRFVAG
jgi:hypothetical protein